MLKERYVKNSNSITKEEMELILTSKVCIIGCGGLGGFIIEILSRVGVGNLVLVDGDTFHESNLNRQLMCTESNIGKSKAQESALRVALINSDIQTTLFDTYLDENNSDQILRGCHVAVDALDNVNSRLILEAACEKSKIPLVHGAIGGWYGHVSTVMPGSKILSKIYSNHDQDGEEKVLGNPPFTPSIIASIQASEVVKLLIGRKSQLENNMLSVDLLNNDYEIIEMA